MPKFLSTPLAKTIAAIVIGLIAWPYVKPLAQKIPVVGAMIK
jgi:hypothetical protein